MNTNRTFRRFVVSRVPLSVFVVALTLVLSTTAPAGKLIDDFTQIALPSNYPHVEDNSSPGFKIIDESGLTNTFAGLRVVSAIPGSHLFPPPIGSSPAITIDVDTSVGELSFVANEDSAMFGFISWASADADETANVDVTPFDRIVLEYSASSDITFELTLGNLKPGTFNTSTGSRGDFVLPAADKGVVELSMAAINIPVIDALSNPIGGPPVFFPPADLTALDSITFSLKSGEGGVSLVLSRVELVPEPAALAIVAGLLIGCSVRLRPIRS